MRLIDIVRAIKSINPELTIYAEKPWLSESEAILAMEPSDGGLPHEASVRDMQYFIEVFVARDFLDDWIASEKMEPSIEEQCKRLIYYAQYDA